jgi:hydroxymethylbilane synthase
MTNTAHERARTGALVIGTRGSPLALVQSELVRGMLMAAHPGLSVSLEVIRTTGDRILGQPLAAIGGKGLFTKEIEEALLDGRVDIAVHSMKDVPSVLPGGLDIPCLLEREDVRDVLIVHDDAVAHLDDLPEGARLGTASLRRAAQALSRRPDLTVVGLRGNVGTRLDKIKAGDADATFLALAGLKRLGLEDAARIILTTDDMLPAVAQGAIGIECREEDTRVHELLAPLDHAPTRICVTAERAVLMVLEGSCRMPIAALATISGTELLLRAMIASPDGRQRFDVQRSGPVDGAQALGDEAGAALRTEAGPEFIAALGTEA